MKTSLQFCYLFCPEPQSQGTGSARSGKVQCFPIVPGYYSPMGTLEKVSTWFLFLGKILVPSSVVLGMGGQWGVNRESVSEFAFWSLQWVLIPRPADPTLGNYREETEGPEGDALAVISSSAPMRCSSASPVTLAVKWNDKELIHLKQRSGSAELEEDSPYSGFFDLGTLDLLQRIILSHGASSCNLWDVLPPCLTN